MSNQIESYFKNKDTSIISEGFLYWLKQNPKALALNCNGIDYSYEDLFNESLTYFSKIKQLKEEIIGVQYQSNAASYAAILAVSYLGSAYLPINSSLPLAKQKEIINDSKINTVLCFNSELSLNESDCNVINLNANESTNSIDFSLGNNSNLSYVLYTSGSTGAPKGVAVSRENINCFFRYYLNEYDFNAQDRFLQPYELSFDVSVFSVFCAWNVGASVHVVPDSSAKQIAIFKTIKEQKITVASMVPGVLKLVEKYLPEFNFTALRYSFFSGDALKHSLATKWKKCLPNGLIHNFYGPTETTIVCTRYVWDEKLSANESLNDVVPIGKCFPFMNSILINEFGECIVELDVPGELCFNGAQVIDNYLHHSHVENFVVIDNIRYYKTGDVVSKNANGNYVFHGRIDTQVKINGYRVELAEIELAIIKCSGFFSKIIVEDVKGINQMFAFIESVVPFDFKAILGNILPLYSIPSKFIFLKNIPLNVNGKVDTQKLKQLLVSTNQQN